MHISRKTLLGWLGASGLVSHGHVGHGGHGTMVSAQVTVSSSSTNKVGGGVGEPSNSTSLGPIDCLLLKQETRFQNQDTVVDYVCQMVDENNVESDIIPVMGVERMLELMGIENPYDIPSGQMMLKNGQVHHLKDILPYMGEPSDDESDGDEVANVDDGTEEQSRRELRWPGPLPDWQRHWCRLDWPYCIRRNRRHLMDNPEHFESDDVSSSSDDQSQRELGWPGPLPDWQRHWCRLDWPYCIRRKLAEQEQPSSDVVFEIEGNATTTIDSDELATMRSNNGKNDRRELGWPGPLPDWQRHWCRLDWPYCIRRHRKGRRHNRRALSSSSRADGFVIIVNRESQIIMEEDDTDSELDDQGRRELRWPGPLPDWQRHWCRLDWPYCIRRRQLQYKVNADGSVDPSSESTAPKSSSRRRRSLATSPSDADGVLTRSVMVLRVTTSDAEMTRTSEQIASSVFGSSIPGGTTDPTLWSQTDKCSNGKLQFVPQTHSNIKNGVAEITLDVNAIGGDTGDICNDAIAKAQADGLPIESTDHVMVCLPFGTLYGGKWDDWIGYAYGGGYQSRFNDEWCTYNSIQMHEVMHNLHVKHSGDLHDTYNDETDMMGYSYEEPLHRCYNGAKLSQFGWYNDRKVQIMPSSSDTPTGSSSVFSAWTGKIISFIHYQKAKDASKAGKPFGGNDQYTVLIDILSAVGDDFYLVYNLAQDFHKDVYANEDQVTIVKGEYQKQSILLGGVGLNSDQTSLDQSYYVIDNFDNTKRNLLIEVKEQAIDVDTNIPFMKLEIGLSCQTSSDCGSADGVSCRAGYCRADENFLLALAYPKCGDGICNGDEDCRTCSEDCLQTTCNALETTMDANSGSMGNMFNVRAKDHEVVIEGFDVHLANDFDMDTDVRVWTRAGSFFGVDKDSSKWTLIQDVNVKSSGPNELTVLPKLPVPITLMPATVRAFYVTVLNGRNRYTKSTISYTSTTPYKEDDFLEFYTGVGKSLPEFDGSTYSSGGSRIFNGSIKYSTLISRVEMNLIFVESATGGELSWKLREHEGYNSIEHPQVLYEGADYGPHQQVNEQFTLATTGPGSCYDLTLYDEIGNGIDGASSGPGYEVLVDGVNIVPVSDKPFAHQRTTMMGNWHKTLSNQIETTMASGTGAAGNMFDIEAKANIEISSLSIHTRLTSSTEVYVYTKGGTAEGSTKDITKWNLIQKVNVVGQGSGVLTKLPSFDTPVAVAKGMTQAFYVTLTSKDIRYTKGSSLGSTWVENQHLSFKQGYGRSLPAFTGSEYYPRVFNGQIHYNVLECDESAVLKGASGHNEIEPPTYCAEAGDLTPLSQETNDMDDDDDSDDSLADDVVVSSSDDDSSNSKSGSLREKKKGGGKGKGKGKKGGKKN